ERRVLPHKLQRLLQLEIGCWKIHPCRSRGRGAPRSAHSGSSRRQWRNHQIWRSSMSMAELRAANVARDQEWNTGSERVSMTFRATELAGEVGEACNVIKKLERERIGLVGSRDTKEHLADELADIVICTDLVAMDAGIDLDAAIAAKFNATSEKNGLATRLLVSDPAARELALEALRSAEQFIENGFEFGFIRKPDE